MLYPFRRGRVPGLAIAHSDSAVGNLAAVWFSCLVVFYNLYRACTAPVAELTLTQLVVFGGLLPVGAWWFATRALRRNGEKLPSG